MGGACHFSNKDLHWRYYQLKLDVASKKILPFQHLLGCVDNPKANSRCREYFWALSTKSWKKASYDLQNVPNIVGNVIMTFIHDIYLQKPLLKIQEHRLTFNKK